MMAQYGWGFLVACIMLTPHDAQALKTRTWARLCHAANAADAAITYYKLDRGTHREANPLLPDNKNGIVIIKFGFSFAIHKLTRRETEAGKRRAYKACAGIMGAAFIWNTLQ